MIFFNKTGFAIGAEGVMIGELPQYFDVSFEVANAIANMGIPLGIMVMPLVTQFLLDVYGWRGTLMILGALLLHLIVCGAVLTPVKREHLENKFFCKNDEARCHQEYESNETRSSNYFDFILFKDMRFISLLLYNVGQGYCITGWLIYLVPHAIDIGFSSTAAAFLATLGGVGNLIACILYPLVKQTLSDKQILYSMSTLGCVALMIDPIFAVSRSYIGLMISSVSLGFGRGMAILAAYTLIRVTIEQDKISNAFIWFTASYSIGSLSSGFLSGIFSIIS